MRSRPELHWRLFDKRIKQTWLLCSTFHPAAVAPSSSPRDHSCGSLDRSSGHCKHQHMSTSRWSLADRHQSAATRGNKGKLQRHRASYTVWNSLQLRECLDKTAYLQWNTRVLVLSPTSVCPKMSYIVQTSGAFLHPYAERAEFIIKV